MGFILRADPVFDRFAKPYPVLYALTTVQRSVPRLTNRNLADELSPELE
jgi:hypothetical protein